MKNRYINLLHAYNKEIIELSPAHLVLRIVAALEIKKRLKKTSRVLDLGCGEGDSAEYVLNRTATNLDLLDISPDMIRDCKKRLAKYKNRLNFICQDAWEYLLQTKPYDMITMSWTLHNFPKADQVTLLKTVFSNLRKGGVLVLMDKIYPNKDSKKFLDIQLERYKKYLPSKAVKAIVDHELQDYSAEYRLTEKSFIALLKKLGFKKVELATRAERDVVIVAQK
jgi:ubiquinone/menaquinone biosynthesis C-methylase UbiE